MLPAAVASCAIALASLHAYFDEGGKRDLSLAALFFTLQVLSSGHGAVVLVIATGGLVVWNVLRGAPVALTPWIRDLGVPGALLLAPAALVYLPYRTVQQEIGLRRSLENWVVTPGSFLAAPTHLQTFFLSLLPGPRILDTASAYLFPGFLPLLLVIAAVAAALLRRGGGGSRPASVAFYGALAAVSVWLSIDRHRPRPLQPLHLQGHLLVQKVRRSPPQAHNPLTADFHRGRISIPDTNKDAGPVHRTGVFCLCILRS